MFALSGSTDRPGPYPDTAAAYSGSFFFDELIAEVKPLRSLVFGFFSIPLTVIPYF